MVCFMVASVKQGLIMILTVTLIEGYTFGSLSLGEKKEENCSSQRRMQ